MSPLERKEQSQQFCILMVTMVNLFHLQPNNLRLLLLKIHIGNYFGKLLGGYLPQLMALMSRVILRAGPSNLPTFFSQNNIFNSPLSVIFDAEIETNFTRKDIDIHSYISIQNAHYRPNIVQQQPIAFDIENGLNDEQEAIEDFDR